MAANTQLCPYCGVRPRSSDDHVFPEFLGGNTTIRACKLCNDLFGHSFEGPVSNDFAPAVVTLRRGGLLPPRRFVWKRAIKREGTDYDLDSDLNLTPSNPSIERDDKGSIKRAVFAGLRATKSFIRGQGAHGKKLKFTPQTIKDIDIRKLEFRLDIGTEARRLAIKIAIAAADHMGFSDGLVDERTKDFLLGNTEKSDKVRLDFVRHDELEKLRPPLSHIVFVKGNSQTHTSYAIVQFYGLVQLYALLNDGGFAGNDFAIIFCLDAAKGYTERFEQTELFRFPEAPVKLGHWEFQRLKLEWMTKFNTEAEAVLEDDAKLSF
jgi:hypothetical protein